MGGSPIADKGRERCRAIFQPLCNQGGSAAQALGDTGVVILFTLGHDVPKSSQPSEQGVQPSQVEDNAAGRAFFLANTEDGVAQERHQGERLSQSDQHDRCT
ncbi:hypothetical protein D3C80_1953120 [compost metagenome]